MLVVIPVRAGSKRLPDKWKRELAGKSLLQWAIDKARATELPFVVATESDIVAGAAVTHGASVFKRSTASALDNSPDVMWAKEVARKYSDELFVVMRITSPFLRSDHVQKMVERLASTGCDSVRCVRRVIEHPGKMWTVEQGTQHIGKPVLVGRVTVDTGAPFHSAPTQLLPVAFVQTAGMEIISRRNLSAGGWSPTIAGERVALYEVSGPEALDINTPDDWARAEEIAKTWTP